MGNSNFYGPKPPRSNRRYKKRLCKNPECEFEHEFIPHRSDQLYCCYQCKVNFNNDLRKVLRDGKFSDVKVQKEIDRKLGKVFKGPMNKNGQCVIPMAYFVCEGIDLTMSVKDRINIKTGRTIRWFFSYGIEAHPDNKDYFIIHKKQVS